ncbi:MAG: undecaprenyldiphospho-muramoylpentapeptide beta-N- acetylglucosaminyltransferase [Candidatus Methanofastidiosum methylothiophilum]|uniref:Undecaprenyldiphospho-muramoylpentapeptide beta-N-acetylglucosaminyltransferase n=1 Tax=Candidatus Methanofastidiosum methylothiophilum TaxID=1705564 RepID=A0A150IJN7_9EURY|nr:MAG: undecaprenyldiphospho-muramoylpentapeptide beta-N- acetylglucosaminyltransferase [Candidatus Methanofastidiosum methylthiophilus]
MKIALVCSHGGHLTEMLFLMDAFKDHDIFFVTYNNFRTEDLGYHKYLLENIKTSPIKMIKAFNQFLRIFRKEKPEIVISTGSEIALPAFIVAKLFRKKTIFIESWCRVQTKSATGKMVYYISDEFLVQWPQQLEIYGDKAKYRGAVI